MRKKLNWTAYSNEERLIAIEKIKDTISFNEGTIMNFSMFSDLALNLSIEVEENKLKILHDALSAILTVSALDFESINLSSQKEWLVFLNISFAKGTGSFKVQIPDVPG